MPVMWLLAQASSNIPNWKSTQHWTQNTEVEKMCITAAPTSAAPVQPPVQCSASPSAVQFSPSAVQPPEQCSSAPVQCSAAPHPSHQLGPQHNH